jgi:hypothetical protein
MDKFFRCTEWSDVQNTFLPTGESRTFGYDGSAFSYSPELRDDVDSGRTSIFIVIKIHYRDFRKVWHGRDFRLVWDHDAVSQNCEKCKKERRALK